MNRWSLILLCLALTVPARAQVLLNSDGATKVSQVIAALPKDATLKCGIEPIKPSLDFIFRFTAGYLVDCPMNEFEGKAINLAAYIRVTPSGSTPLVLMEQYQIPAISPEDTAKLGRQSKKLRGIFSGGFAVGEGEYLVDVLLVDGRSRFCRKQWKISVAKSHAQKNVPLAVKSGAVYSIRVAPWDGKLVKDGTGLRVAILLDAVPMDPRGPKLRAWDRAFLMGTLLTLLQQMPCESVRLTAFSLDQQQEVFRKDPFDAPAFVGLSRALQNVEFGTVSYRALQRDSVPKMLAALANQELNAEKPVDVVIILGPVRSLNQKIPTEMLEDINVDHSKVFYFEYYPWLRAEFPDAIERLTKSLHGTVFKIHSPGDFGKSVQTMIAQLQSIKENKMRNSGPEATTPDK